MRAALVVVGVPAQTALRAVMSVRQFARTDVILARISDDCNFPLSGGSLRQVRAIL